MKKLLFATLATASLLIASCTGNGNKADNEVCVYVTADEVAPHDAEARQQSNADYLAQLEQEADIQKLPTGEYYKVLTEGKGAVPAADETVKVHYEGRLLDGTVFDSSYERNQPIEIDMARPGVIQGWVDVLKVMPKGSKWEVTLPSELAYGEYGAGNAIPAHSVLVFTMELLK